MMRRKLFVGVSLLAAFALSCPASAGTKYSYDSAGRLIQAEYASGVTIRYSYDAAGNRRAITTTQLPNRAPVAANDSASVVTSSAVDIQVRANDSDPDRNPLTITSVSAVTGGGAAVIMGGGAYIRFTAPSTAGTKTFTYTLSDGKGGTAIATVTVVVDAASPPNGSPVALNDNATVVTSGVVNIYVRANDSDPDGDILTVTSVSSVSGGGTATIVGGGTHIQFTAPATAGNASFTYTISDGKGGSATATVSIAISAANSAPNAVNDSTTLQKGTSKSVMVLANDSDPDGDPITITSVSTPTAGTVVIGPGGAHVVYTAPGYTDINTFTYTISDGRGGTATATVTVTVNNPGGPLDR